MSRARGMVGEVMLFGADFVPEGWLACDGARVAAASYPALFAAIGTTYGGDASSFALPDLRGRMALGASGDMDRGATGGVEAVTLGIEHMPPHTHSVVAGPRAEAATATGNVWSREVLAAGQGEGRLHEETVGIAGAGEPHDNMPPFLSMVWLIRATDPDLDWGDEAFLGEIRLYAGATPPPGWRRCHGQELPIAEHPALYSVVVPKSSWQQGTTFRLPDLRARFALGAGDRRPFPALGSRGGHAAVRLEENHLPHHYHSVAASDAPGQAEPAGHVPARGTEAAWSRPTLERTSVAGPLQVTGGGQPHENMPPYLTLDYLICTDGLFPIRD